MQIRRASSHATELVAAMVGELSMRARTDKDNSVLRALVVRCHTNCVDVWYASRSVRHALLHFMWCRSVLYWRAANTHMCVLSWRLKAAQARGSCQWQEVRRLTQLLSAAKLETEAQLALVSTEYNTELEQSNADLEQSRRELATLRNLAVAARRCQFRLPALLLLVVVFLLAVAGWMHALRVPPAGRGVLL